MKMEVNVLDLRICDLTSTAEAVLKAKIQLFLDDVLAKGAFLVKIYVCMVKSAKGVSDFSHDV